MKHFALLLACGVVFYHFFFLISDQPEEAKDVSNAPDDQKVVENGGSDVPPESAPEASDGNNELLGYRCLAFTCFIHLTISLSPFPSLLLPALVVRLHLSLTVYK